MAVDQGKNTDNMGDNMSENSCKKIYTRWPCKKKIPLISGLTLLCTVMMETGVMMHN